MKSVNDRADERSCSNFKFAQRGVTSIEYALIAALLAIAIIAGVSGAGGTNAFNWSGWTGKLIAAIEAVLGK